MNIYLNKLCIRLAICMLLVSCATVEKTTELVKGGIDDVTDLAVTSVQKIGELTIQVVTTPINFVRGNLLYGKVDNVGRTVLHYAVVEKNVDEVRRLLSEGAPRKYDDEGMEPYHLAIIDNNVEIMEVFASYSQELDKPTQKQLPTLHLAVLHSSDKAFDWLLRAGQDINITEPSNNYDVVRFGIVNNKHAFIEQLHNRIDVNQKDASGDAYIHTATRVRNAEAIHTLVTIGNDIDALNLAGDTPLLLAVEQARSIPTIQRILDEKPNLEFRDTNGDTPLLRTIRANYPQNLALLIDAGADPQVIDKNGFTSIFVALPNNNAELINELTRAGVNLNQYNQDGLAPIHKSVVENYPRVVVALVKNGADVELPILQKGVTALMLAARLGNAKLQNELTKLGASNHTRDIAGNTALHYAARFNFKKSVTQAIRNNADLNAQNYRGETPLHVSIYGNASSSFTEILKNKPNLNVRDTQFRQPLHATLYTANQRFLRNLLTAGADVDSPNKNGVTPLVEMIYDNNIETVDLLIENNASLTREGPTRRLPIHIAALINRPEIIILLAKATSPANPFDENGQTPLHLAALQGNTLSIRALVRNGGYADIRDLVTQRTPLHFAAVANQPEAIEELMNSGANASLRDAYGQTPLFSALSANATKSFAPLLRNSYRNYRDYEGNTALLAALKQGKIDQAKQLLHLGVSPSSGNLRGETPIYIAWQQQNADLLGAIANKGGDITLPTSSNSDLCIQTVQPKNTTPEPTTHNVSATSAVLSDNQTTHATTNAITIRDTTATNTQFSANWNNVDIYDNQIQAPTLITAERTDTKTTNDNTATHTIAQDDPSPLAQWERDCIFFLNDQDYLRKRSRWILLGQNNNYQASRWWNAIPIPSTKGDDVLENVVTDVHNKLRYYLTYSLPEKYLPPIFPPEKPQFAIKQLENETNEAYIERLDYYQETYINTYNRELQKYENKKANRLTRIAQMRTYHQTLDVTAARPSINFIADALQHHYQHAFTASNGVYSPSENALILEIPLASIRETLVVKIFQNAYQENFDFLRNNWRNLKWYIGSTITPDAITFLEVVTQGIHGPLFIPLESDDPQSLKVLVNKFNAI